ncbi:MAG: cytochrome ubiquinol oxidase subunit I [Candidatus Eisenbacteria bacterium]|uniref:Cytochrome ubiquinol oxidase subunit I n=1 Tax=Eiseniibacteriota bacterium TaxID=2212470 RepID=A0A956M2N8_UNCEI|nr:cytochrome ubiquinol oxidase subunit I [Candidatus Eisenbacteria bacterium]
MESALGVHRFQFAFTIVFHYLFPQLTMGLALLLAVFKTLSLRAGGEPYARAARFWGRIFAVTFGMGVVTGIPMEFQFGTNWARFSELAGGVLGQTLAMEGVFAFFLESTFLGLFLFGEKKLGPRGHWIATLGVFVGSWLSGFFIVATNAWMQHPVGYEQSASGAITLTSLTAVLSNPWLRWQYPHTMLGAVVTGSVVVTAVAALYLLGGRHVPQAKVFLRVGVPAAFLGLALSAFPTGDRQAMNIALHQPVAFAAMEALFHSEEGAPLVLIGQPDMESRRIDNPIHVPKMLSFLTYKRWNARIRGLDEFPPDEWPERIPLLYYTYHVMVGLGTILLGIFALSVLLLWRNRLWRTTPVLWVLLFLPPFPYIANTAGWLTAELGRQPWLVQGLLRTSEGSSTNVSSGSVYFSLLGFMGLYTLLSILYLSLVGRSIRRGPDPEPA